MIQNILLLFISLPIIIIFLLLLLWCYSLYKYRDLKVPGPPTIPIIGHKFIIGITSEKLYATLRKLSKTYRGLFKLHMGPTEVYLIISDPKYLGGILNSNSQLNKSSMYAAYKSLLNEGIATCKSDLWKPRRKMYNASFSKPMLNDFLNTFNLVADKVTKRILAQNGEIVDYNKEMELTGLNIILESGMGVVFDGDISNHINYIERVNKYMQNTMLRVFSFWKRNEFLFKLTKEYKEQEDNIKHVNDYTMNVIKKRIKELEKFDNSTSDNSVDDIMGMKKRSVIIDILIDLEKSNVLTLDDIKYEVNTFIFAAYETTSAAMTFLLYELSRHPNIQKKIYEELRAISNGEQLAHFTMQQLNDMKYLECAIKESLRLYPIVPFIDRQLDQDVQLEDIFVPKGTCVGILISALHQDETIYPEPDRFDPDRFLPENSKNRHPLAFIPFSYGPRNCMGYRYAMLEIKCVIAKIVQHFNIVNVDPTFKIKLRSNTTLKSANGFGSVKFVPRNKII